MSLCLSFLSFLGIELGFIVIRAAVLKEFLSFDLLWAVFLFDYITHDPLGRRKAPAEGPRARVLISTGI